VGNIRGETRFGPRGDLLLHRFDRMPDRARDGARSSAMERARSRSSMLCAGARLRSDARDQLRVCRS
jgi:hypothetical protein